MTYREIIYLIIDELKISSDDSLFNENHVKFLCEKYRTFLLKKTYLTSLKFGFVPESNYQTLCLDLVRVPSIQCECCGAGDYLRSDEKIPNILPIGVPKIYPTDYFQGEITYVSRDRMKYIGYNKWLKNIIYCSLSPDNYLFFKSPNPQFLYLESVKITAVFENIAESSCEEEETCDVVDREFPIEPALVPPLVELVTAELGKSVYKIEDENNDAKDNLAVTAKESTPISTQEQ